MIEHEEIKAAWRDLGRRLAQLRKAAGYTQHSFAPRIRYGRSSIANVETGHQQPGRSFWARCDAVLDASGILTEGYDQVKAMEERLHRQRAMGVSDSPASPVPPPPSIGVGDNRPSPFGAESIRQRVEQAVGHSNVAGSSLDDWELTVAEHARATRHRPAQDLLHDLLADIDDLQLVLHGRRHTTSSLRRTTVITAQMAGLISLTLLKLNAFTASRRWGRTARAAAAEAGDPVTSSWVWAQEAYRHFYADQLTEAITVARYAQHLAGRVGGVGVVLATALQARAHAATGDAQQTRRTLHQAEENLAGLGSVEATASAFGYDEAQLRFHAGNAYTHLGDTQAARTEQDRALLLYPPSDYLDRALVHLDRAACLIYDGDTNSGVQQLTTVVTELPPAQRDGLVLTRARHIIATVPTAQRTAAAVREARDLLAVCASQDKEPAQ